MRILIIPDVHGRDFWKKPIYEEEYDLAIFLGDYLDHYPGESTVEQDISNFKEILEFKKKFPDKVILLIGNHDFSYYNEDIYEAEEYWCRHDHVNHVEIHKLFEDNKDLFQLYCICNNFCESIDKKELLFTHAGFTNGYFNMISNVFGTTNIDELCEELFKPKNHPALIFYVSWYRGGGEQSGSIVWADVREHNEIPNKYLMPYYQIFGHTYARNPIIEKHWAMLDYGKSCFILDEESLHNV